VIYFFENTFHIIQPLVIMVDLLSLHFSITVQGKAKARLGLVLWLLTPLSTSKQSIILPIGRPLSLILKQKHRLLWYLNPLF
jgi:hypothetical protein